LWYNGKVDPERTAGKRLMEYLKKTLPENQYEPPPLNVPYKQSGNRSLLIFGAVLVAISVIAFGVLYIRRRRESRS
jgi:hypothetical protein